MTYEAGDQPTPEQKLELQKTRLKLGRKMARLIKLRSLDETHDTVHDRESDEAADIRNALWQAENNALRADPHEEYYDEASQTDDDQ